MGRPVQQLLLEQHCYGNSNNSGGKSSYCRPRSSNRDGTDSVMIARGLHRVCVLAPSDCQPCRVVISCGPCSKQVKLAIWRFDVGGWQDGRFCLISDTRLQVTNYPSSVLFSKKKRRKVGSPRGVDGAVLSIALYCLPIDCVLLVIRCVCCCAYLA